MKAGILDAAPGHYARWLGYGLAIGLTAATLIPTLALQSWVGRPILIPFLLSIILSAYVGGFGTGLFATVLAAAASAFFLLPPEMSLSFDRPVELLDWLWLWAVGILASALTARARLPEANGLEPDERALALTEWKVRWGFVLALACFGVVGTVSFMSVMRLRDAAGLVAQTQETMRSLDGIRESLSDAEISQRAYLISGQGSDLSTYRNIVDGFDGLFGGLRALTVDEAEQQERIERLVSLIEARLRNLDATVVLRASQGFEAVRLDLSSATDQELQTRIRALIGDMTSTELAVLGQRQRAAESSSDTAHTVIILGAMVAVALVGAVLFGLRRDFAHRRHVERMMRALRGDLEARVSERTGELEQTARRLEAEIVARSGAQQTLQSQVQRLNLLQHITRGIAARRDLPSICAGVLGTLEEQLPVDFCCVGMRNDEYTHLTITAIGSRGLGFAAALGLTGEARLSITEGGFDRCMRGDLLYEPDVSGASFPFAQSLARVGLCSLLVAPLQVEDEIFGALICARRHKESFNSSDCEFLRQVSEHVALASHQAQLYEALRKAYEHLRQSQRAVLQQERLRALGQMASGIAHDVNNSISPVTLYLESLLEDLPHIDPDARRRLETVQRAVGDVAQTIARLREFSRERESQLDLQPVDLNDIARQVVGLTHARWFDMAQRRGVSIMVRLDLAAGLPAIMGVASELRDALVNLMFNAIDAMPDGGPVTLRTAVAEEPGPPGAASVRTVRLEVSDCGIGMDEETRRRCMEPFFTTKGERGTGLGLAMVYGTMQRHGSDVEIDSAPGKGATFRFRFPVPTAAVAAVEETAPIDIPPLHILLVDDDPLVARAVRETLRKDGHRVSCAEGGQAGIDAFNAAREDHDPFDVVMSDLGMPFVDGRAVCSSVKATAPETTAILLTGWGHRMLAAGESPADVDCIVAKPPTRRDLRVALAQCLSRRKVA